ncbi:MAG: hypothetical protein QF460_00745 [Candidatus Nanoarchaeia archaeon]|jgi:hypothetical protein|nr:hypothetical protein [Candidatus Nanoarchaeia archaeon]|tara:strand:+ start:5670 stop:6749 length:1080 start_codon:yes stop_codon:yes gene_type:complete
MKKGYVIGEYIIVSFFFLMLIVGVVSQLTETTAFEANKISSDISCESAERLFRDVVDKSPVEITWKKDYNNFIGGTTSLTELRKNWTHFGISTGNTYEVDYTALDFLINNVSLINFTQFLNSGESFKISHEVIGVDVGSIYSTKLDLTNKAPRAQIWMNATSGVANDNIVHNVLGIAAGSNASGARFETELFFPNATIIGTQNSSLDSGDLVTISNGTEGASLTVDFSIGGSDEDILYVAYTVNDTSIPNWDSTWTTGGATFLNVDKIVTKNNLIMFKNLKLKNVSLDREYSIYLGNNTLAKGSFGAEQRDSSDHLCEYNRMYKIIGGTRLSSQSIVDSARVVNITPTLVAELSVLIGS